MRNKILSAVLVAAGMAVAADGPTGLIRYKLEYLPHEEKARNAITRAYLGYEASVNDAVSGKIVGDVQAIDEEGNGKERYSYFLKFAQMDWKVAGDDLALRFGLYAPAYQTQVNANWGYLFLVDPVLLGQSGFSGSTKKKNGVFLPSADLGMELSAKINDNIKAYAGIMKGDGFKTVNELDRSGPMGHPAGMLQIDIAFDRVMASIGGVVRMHNEAAVNDQVEVSPNLHFGMKSSVLRAGLEAAARFNRGGSLHDADQIFSAALYSVYSIKANAVEAILRGEYFGTQEEESSSTRGIFGLALLPSPKMKVVLHYDLETAVAKSAKSQQVVGLASQISF